MISRILVALVLASCTASSPRTTSEASPTSAEPSAVPTAADPCASIQEVVIAPGVVTTFPASTASEVVAGAAMDPLVRLTLEDVAGVRNGPLGDPRVPRCRLDLLHLGDPIFVRRLVPAQRGSWLVPVQIGDQRLLTLFIGVDATGRGRYSGSIGGFPDLSTEAIARAAGSVAGDAVVSAELVFAKPAGCAPRDTISWRLVRRSGTVVYLVPGYPGVPPPGVIVPEDRMEFSVSGRGAGLASIGAAC